MQIAATILVSITLLNAVLLEAQASETNSEIAAYQGLEPGVFMKQWLLCGVCTFILNLQFMLNGSRALQQTSPQADQVAVPAKGPGIDLGAGGGSPGRRHAVSLGAELLRVENGRWRHGGREGGLGDAIAEPRRTVPGAG